MTATRGDLIMSVVQPFYGWKPTFKPVLPDIEKRARKAIFWRKIGDVRVFRQSETGPLRASIKATLLASYWDGLNATVSASLRTALSDSLRDSLSTTLKNTLSTPAWNAFAGSFGGALRIVVKDSIFYATGQVSANQQVEADKFKPLFDLFFAGNFPLGFDKDNNLLVLVA